MRLSKHGHPFCWAASRLGSSQNHKSLLGSRLYLATGILRKVCEVASESSDSANLKDRYKDTVNLPKTDFPMKGNLPQTEPEMIKRWHGSGLYQKILAANKSKPIFAMPDGPPYANGNIHIGHALNKCLKDFVVKYKNMNGFLATFIPGWDCHGLPIEQNVTKQLGSKRKEKTDTEIRKLCRHEAQSWVDKQRAQFTRLGILADWENPYLTMSPDYEAEEVRELGRIFDRGLLYRGEKPVYWCPTLQTALAEAEVEYHPHRSPSIYVKFPIEKDLERLGKPDKPVSVVIWTTTPWTLPANLGVALHPQFEYELFDTGAEYLLLAKELAANVAQETGLQLKGTGRIFKGQDLEKVRARHPFYDRDSLFVLGEHVSLDAGTGAVHTAPGHGQDDYQVGLKYGLGILSPVDSAGNYSSEVPEYEGQNIFAMNPVIVERLRKDGKLLGFKEIEHSYPHNWRSKTPLIFRATPQWFIRMDDPQNNIRQKTLQQIEKIRFVPKWGENRLRSMIENRPDWCLSRQRIWGVPIPVFYCKKCQTPLVKSSIMNRVADTMEKEDGIEAFYRHPASDFVQDEKCSKCGHTEFEHSKDILDVWFDSGICHAAVQKRRKNLAFPADIYLEGSDQHRGWFQTSLLSSMASNGTSPFKALVTHGFVNDLQGRKMSKSVGNVVDPQETIKKSGAEIVRLWVAYEDYGQDLTCGPESFERITETYRRFRNTVRFLLGNLHEFDPVKDSVEYQQMMPLDRWALGQLNALINKCTEAYDNYEFYKVYHSLNTFFTVDLSATYLDILKDRLYTWKRTGVERRSAQTVLYQLVTNLVGLMAPILSFLAEETYQSIPGNKKESVFLTPFPRPRIEWEDTKHMAEFAELFAVRSEVSKALEEKRKDKVIGSSLEAKITICAGNDNRGQILRHYEKYLPEFFIVSQVALKSGNFSVQVEKALGEKCVRCWNYNEQTGQDARFPGTCPKCWKALT